MSAAYPDYKTFPAHDLAAPEGCRPAKFRAHPFVITIKAISPRAADKAAAVVKSGLLAKGAVIEGPLRRPVRLGHWSTLAHTAGRARRATRKPYQIWRVNLYVYEFDYPTVDAMHWMDVPFSCVFEISSMPADKIDAYRSRRDRQRRRWEERQARKKLAAERATESTLDVDP